MPKCCSYIIIILLNSIINIYNIVQFIYLYYKYIIYSANHVIIFYRFKLKIKLISIENQKNKIL